VQGPLGVLMTQEARQSDHIWKSVELVLCYCCSYLDIVLLHNSPQLLLQPQLLCCTLENAILPISRKRPSYAARSLVRQKPLLDRPPPEPRVSCVQAPVTRHWSLLQLLMSFGILQKHPSPHLHSLYTLILDFSLTTASPQNTHNHVPHQHRQTGDSRNPHLHLQCCLRSKPRYSSIQPGHSQVRQGVPRRPQR
jgi:hypothetical protein